MNQEITANTSWQNEGMCNQYSIDKLKDTDLRSLYMYFVRYSFGYGKKITDRISQLKIANDNGMTKKTLIAKLKQLEELKMIKIIPPDTYIKGGGSTSCAYAPDYPRGYGKIKFKDEDNKSGSKVKKEDSIKTKEPEKEVKSNMIYVEGKDYDF